MDELPRPREVTIRPQDAVATFIEAVARTNGRLAAFAETLRNCRAVSEVVKCIDFRPYQSGTIVEMFVDATGAAAGDSVCWWLELYASDARWTVESRVLHTGGEGQSALQEFPDRTASTVSELALSLDAAVGNLIDCRGWVRRLEAPIT